MNKLSRLYNNIYNLYNKLRVGMLIIINVFLILINHKRYKKCILVISVVICYICDYRPPPFQSKNIPTLNLEEVGWLEN